MMRRILTVLALLLATLAAHPARAQRANSQKVQVLTLMSDKGFQQAQALTIAFKRAVTRADGWRLGKGDFSLEVLVAALNCPSPPNSACQKKISAKVGTNRYVWGTLKLEGKQVVAILHLWENGSEKQQATLRYSANLTDPSDDSLLKIAEDGFSRLVGAAEGKLELTAGSVTGDVLVDGQRAGGISGGRAELSLPAGDHEVRVRASGYHEATGTVTIKSGGSAQLQLYPSAVAGAGSPGDHGPSGPTDYRSIAGWATLGVGGAVALTGGYFWLHSFLQSENPPDYYTEYKKGDVGNSKYKSDICAGARSKDYPNPQVANYCDKNTKTKTVAFILVPVGAVIAGVGTYLLLTDEPSKAEKDTGRLQPSFAIGPGGGRFDVSMAF